jgi:hypothetical protein
MNAAEHIIETLGGTRKAAALLGLPASTVQSWKTAGVIPPRRQRCVLDMAVAAGIPLKAEDFIPPRPSAEPLAMPVETRSAAA